MCLTYFFEHASSEKSLFEIYLLIIIILRAKKLTIRKRIILNIFPGTVRLSKVFLISHC